MSTTLKQERDTIRSFYGLTAKEFTNASIDDFINTAQPNVIIDLIKAGIGIDNYRKTTIITYDINTVFTSASSSQVMLITTVAAAHGYLAGDFVLWDKDVTPLTGDPHPELRGEYEIIAVPANNTFQIRVNVIDGFWGAGYVSLGYAPMPTDIIDMDDAIEKIEVKFQDWDGLGALTKGENKSYRQATKKTISDGVDTNYLNENVNTFEKATTEEPFYWIDGSRTGTKVIHIRPITVESVRIRYRYKPAALTTDAQTLTVPDEHKDLIRKYVKRFIEEKRGATAEKVAAIQEYEDDLKLQIQKYSMGKNTKETEKQETKTK